LPSIGAEVVAKIGRAYSGVSAENLLVSGILTTILLSLLAARCDFVFATKQRIIEFDVIN
jgi:hypothetical protein